jgi:hypothetical protein
MRFKHRHNRTMIPTVEPIVTVVPSVQPIASKPVVTGGAIIKKIKDIEVSENKLDSYKQKQERLKKFVSLKII